MCPMHIIRKGEFGGRKSMEGRLFSIDESDWHRIRLLFSSCGPLFIALGDEVRQQLVLDIAEGQASNEEGINVSDLSAKSKLSRPAISHHLKVLKDYGIIKPRKVGTQIFYTLSLDKNLEEVAELVRSIQKLMAKIYPDKHILDDGGTQEPV